MNANDGTDPRFYKWGFFYYNPDDKRVFPPKRRPEFGWTVNFANWKSVAVFVAMLAAFLLLVCFIEARNVPRIP